MTYQLALLSAACAFAANVQVPLYVNVEGSYVGTNATVDFPYERIDQPVASWNPPARDAAGVAFATLMKGVAAGDANAVSRMYRPLPASSANGAALEPITAKQFTETYRQTFSNFRVLGRVPVSAGEFLYIWLGDTKQGALVRGFHYRAGAFSEITSQSPLEAFIVNSLGRAPTVTWMMDAPERANVVALTVSVKAPKVRILLPASDNPSRDQVASQIFTQFTSLALSGKFDNTQSLMTPESARRLTGWVNTVAEKDRSAFQNFLGDRRRVLRIAQLGPVDIAFWISAKIDKPLPEDLQYSYVVWRGDRPQLANLLFQGILDDVLRRNPEVARWCGITMEPAAPAAAVKGD